MRRITIIAGVLIALFFDAILFQRLNIAGIRPDVLLALVVNLGILQGSVTGGVTGLCAGLVCDLLFGPGIGLHAGLYFLCGVVSGLFYRRFWADNYTVHGLCGLCCAMVKELVLALVTALLGSHLPFGRTLFTYILPCAVCTGLLSMVLRLPLKSLLEHQTRRHYDHRNL